MLLDEKADKMIIDYFNYKYDLETLHTLLYRHFKSYKKAVTYLYDNERRLVAKVNTMQNKQNCFFNIPPIM